MLIQLVADLHPEFYTFNKFEKTLNKILPPKENDKDIVLCLSGDCGTFTHYASTYKPLFALLSKRFKAIIICPGNHTLYSSALWGKEKEFWKDKKLPKNVYYMDNDHVIIDDVVFIGSCLWTNFNNEDPLAMFHASKSMNDFRIIKKRDYVVNAEYGQIIESNRLTPEDTVKRHYESIAYIQLILDMYKDKRCVVVTHHNPSEMCVEDMYRGDLLNYAYFSNLEEFIMDRPQIKLWASGHCHRTLDTDIGNTRYIINSYGYIGSNTNDNYDDNLIVEV